MANYVGTRNTSGNGDAIITAGATERLRLGNFVQLQLNEAGPCTVLLKFGSTTIYSVTLQSAGDGVVVTLPAQVSALADPLYINLSAAKAVGYVVDIDKVTW
jgi:hypothetical protein